MNRSLVNKQENKDSGKNICKDKKLPGIFEEWQQVMISKTEL